MVVVLSPEKDIENEITILNELFEAGLQYYHLRKPTKSYNNHIDYLEQIDAKYHNKIVVHFFHELVNDYNLKGIHFQEQKRINTLNNLNQYFKNLDSYGKTISSSFHEPEDITTCKFNFDYHFLSPVFSSISKPGYLGRGFNINHIHKMVIGMGGVTPENIETFKALGFNGVGVLGGIWNSSTPVKVFEGIKIHFE